MQLSVSYCYKLVELYMKKVDFLFRYEHKVREIESISLIRLELERRGYTVGFIGNYEYDNNQNYKPRVFVAPAIYNNGQLVGDWSKYGAIKKIANMQWEQLFHIEEEEKPNAFHNITGVGQRAVNFCWGNSTKERIVRGGVLKDRAIVVGQINTDMVRGKFKEVLQSKKDLSIKYSIDYSKKWLLFMSSFAHCEMEEHQAAMSRAARGDDNFEMMSQIAYKSRDIILDWFEEVLKKDPSLIIIYRPHPDETGRYSRFRDMTSKYMNFKVISGDAIKHWVNSCDKIYNWYSTGIVDAIILGTKPYRLLRPVNLPKSTDYKLMFTAEKITSREEFLSDLYDYSIKKIIPQDVFDSYFYIPDNYVYITICDVLEKLLKTNAYDICYTSREKAFINRLYVKGHIINFVKAIVPNIFIDYLRDRSEKARSYRQMLKDGYQKNVVTPKELNDIFSRLKSMLYN